MTPASATPYRDRVVLVTGGAGFIGHHVVRALADAGARVSAVVRDISRVSAVGGVKLVAADLTIPGAAAEIVRQVRPAVTFNLAGYGVDPSERDAQLAERLNATLVAELADACGTHADASWHGQHLVHTGSALEYGAAIGNLQEDTVPLPTTSYGVTKLAGTNALLAAGQRGTVRGLTARLFTVYGPGEHGGRLLPSLLDAQQSDAPLALTAGAQRRDFTFVGDAVDGLLRLGLTEGKQLGVVNLATGTLESVRRFAERAADVIGLRRDLLRFGAVPTRGEEMQHDAVSVVRLTMMCRWKPETTIDDGVRITFDAVRRTEPA